MAAVATNRLQWWPEFWPRLPWRAHHGLRRFCRPPILTQLWRGCLPHQSRAAAAAAVAAAAVAAAAVAATVVAVPLIATASVAAAAVVVSRL